MLTKTNTKIIFVMALTASLVLVALNVTQESEGISSSYYNVKQANFIWGYNGSRDVNFSAMGSGISNYTWDFGDGSTGYGRNVEHTYSGDNNYTITLVMRKGGDNITVSQYLNMMDGGTPTVDFYWEPETPTTQEVVQFWDNSTDPDGNGDIYNWTWDFGDGNVSYEQNPAHRYAKGGTYDVTLFVKDHSSGGNGASKQIIVLNIPPVANFYWTRDNSSITFLDYSHDIDGSIVNWTWDFGDGNISHEQNPTHNYRSYGTYHVTLTVKDDDSGTGFITKEINTLDQIPYVNFFWSPINPTILDTVQFNDSSYDVDDSIVNWTWDFGDGNISHEQNPMHKYTEKKTYTVTLTVIDERDALNTLLKDLKIVNAPPVVNFSYEPAYPADGETINFTDNSYDADGNIVNWTWDFGDGNISYERNASHNFSQSGTYSISLTVTDNDGASSRKVCNITISNIYVDDDAPPEWYDERHVHTIQEAINNASEGYHIYVLEGNYRENVVINKFVIIKGENAVVDGTGSGDVITVTSDKTEIDGLTVTNASNGVGLEVDGNNVTIKNCLITENKIGVFMRGNYTAMKNNEIGHNINGVVITSALNTLENNEILDNSNGTEIKGDRNDISKNNFTDNGFAIEVKSGDENKIAGNNFRINSFAVDVYTQGTCNILDNNVEKNGNGIRLFSDNSTSVENNTLKLNAISILVRGDGNEIINCSITQNSDKGIDIGSSYNVSINGCSFSGNDYGVYIDKSDYITIINSKFDSHNYDGVYALNSSRVWIFNSSFSHGGTNIENSTGIVIRYCNYTGGNYGLAISNSQVLVENCTVYESDAGIKSYESNVTIRHSEMYENEIGIKVQGQASIDNCSIHGNTYGIFASGWSGRGVNTSLSENTYGVYLLNSSYSFMENLSLLSNDYGIYLKNSSFNTVANCTLSSNGKGISIADSSQNQIRNNTIDQSATALEIINSRHNTISGNEIKESHIGIRISYAPLNTFVENALSGNDYGIDIEGNEVEHFYENMDVSNKVNGMAVYYLVNQSGINLSGGLGYLALINCVNITIEVSTESNGEGILVVNSSDFSIHGCNFSNNIDGMTFILSSNGIIKNTTVSNNADDGMTFILSSNVSITNCYIFSNGQRGINAYSLGHENGGFTVKDCRIYLNWLGINIENINSNTIEGNTLYDNEKSGLRLFKSDSSFVSGNTIHGNMYGIEVISSSSNISGNTMWKNGKGISLSDSNEVTMNGNKFNDSDTGLSAMNSGASMKNCMFYNNTNGTSIYESTLHLTNCSFTNNTYGIYSSSSTPTTDGCKFILNKYGIFLYMSDHSDIANCTGSNNTYGILVNSSSHTDITNCSISGNAYGLFIGDSTNNTMDRCTVYNNTYGIEIVNESEANVIIETLIHHNMHGMEITADNNKVINCSLWKNVYGLINGGNFNSIYHNNFAYNIENAIDKGVNNSWDNGYPSGGNYWSDYASTDNYKGVLQNISGSDGIGDIPYEVPGGSSTDSYPLMNTYEDAANIPNSPPTALFSYYPANPFSGDTINFMDRSTDPNGEIDITSWHWNFGDGNISNKQNPTHEYNHSGIYNISLTVTDNYGENDTYNTSIEVLNLPPVANFSYSPSNPSTSDTVQFTDKSTDGDGTVANWTWDFGDGSISHEQNPTHKYNDNGIYTVTLTITDNEGAEAKIMNKVTVANSLPTANFFFIPEKASVGEKINFTDGSNDDDGEIIAWHWDFGDGSASDKQNPQHAYTKSGKYTVKLTVRDNDGGENTITKTVEVTSSASTPGFGVMVLLAGLLLAIGMRRRKV